MAGPTRGGHAFPMFRNIQEHAALSLRPAQRRLTPAASKGYFRHRPFSFNRVLENHVKNKS